MKRVFLTGAAGFIGKNLAVALGRDPAFEILPYDIHSGSVALSSGLDHGDALVHLAGVNRPEDEREYEVGNAGLTEELVESLLARGRAIPVLFASSIQATLDNAYGRSKRKGEDTLVRYAEATGAAVYLFRFPNVFGKWCRPNYNSAVATFCHNIARDLPVTISDPARELELVYVDDVVSTFLSLLNGDQQPGVHWPSVSPSFRATLGQIVDHLYSFKASRQDLRVPAFDNPFIKRLYATYLSYLPEDSFAYDLDKKEDSRGALAELLKAPAFGQIFVSRTKPGITRGNHYHNTKTEKFCVVEGEAVIRFRNIQRGEVITYRVSGHEFKVVDIPPGYTHSIENVGAREMVVLFWASEPFDPTHPDTYGLDVVERPASR